MATYFVSDFHLGSRSAEIEQKTVGLLCAFLRQHRGDLEHLVILGDLFDFWFEYRNLVPKGNLELLFWLKQLVDEGVVVSYVCGNHDFWLGDFMTKHLGFAVYNNELVLENGERRVLVLHGDGVAPSDWKYRILKRILRNRLNAALYRLLPPSFAFWLAHKVSGRSRRYGDQSPREGFLREYYEYSRQRHTEGYSAVICGHLHYPEIQEFDSGFYVNCGDWLSHNSVVRWDGSKFELLTATEEIEG
jgi:UDP-2,3-diacylglucosamine hydrolase